jgi:hypothetical protein
VLWFIFTISPFFRIKKTGIPKEYRFKAMGKTG